MTQTTRSPEPFPWLCGQCGAENVFPEKIPYETSLRYEGRDYPLVVAELPALKCRQCGAVLLHNESDACLSSAFRKRLSLLQPETIREGRKRLGLTPVAMIDPVPLLAQITRFHSNGKTKSPI